MMWLLAIGIATVSAADAPVDAWVTLDPPIIPFHRQTLYTVTVEAPAELDVTFPEMAHKFGGLAIYGPPVRATETLSNGRRRVSESYTLDPIFIGYYPIAPAVAQLSDGRTLTVPSPAVQVRDLTTDEAEVAMRFEDNAGLISIKDYIWLKWWFWAPIAVVVVALSAYLVARWLRRRRSTRQAPPLPPWEIAYARLRDLDECKLPEAGEADLFYVELSDVLRSYIELRFDLHAPERTTQEFLSEAGGSGLLSDAHQRRLARFLRHSDRVKFAMYEPCVDEMEKSFALVLHFIDETVPRVSQDGEDAA